MKVLRDQLGHFLTGFIFWLPIGIVILLGAYIYSQLEQLGWDFLHLFVPENYIYPGIGLLFWIVLFVITGNVLKRLPPGTFLSNMPFVGFLFRRDGEMMTLSKLKNLTPCLFLYSPTCISYGWILSDQGVKVGSDGAAFGLVNVYYPNVPTLVTGQVYAARKETVMRLGNSSTDLIDVLLYGLRSPLQLKYLPWDNEGEEEFKERSARFGLEDLKVDFSARRIDD